MTLVDTNILFDVTTKDPIWWEWSLSQLERAAYSGSLVINAVVYAELSTRYTVSKDVDDLVAGLGMDFQEVPRAALFLAGKAFQRYRRQGGIKTGVLSDFFIGAHAVVSGMPLLTRDRARYATYFPAIQLIAPDRT